MDEIADSYRKALVAWRTKTAHEKRALLDAFAVEYELNALNIASYLHAVLVGIHPFADGNGRVARLQ